MAACSHCSHSLLMSRTVHIVHIVFSCPELFRLFTCVCALIHANVAHPSCFGRHVARRSLPCRIPVRTTCRLLLRRRCHQIRPRSWNTHCRMRGSYGFIDAYAFIQVSCVSCRCIYLSVCLSVCLSICLSRSLSLFVSAPVSVSASVSISASVSLSLSARLDLLALARFSSSS